ncbi:MAG TPA: ECF transporter S component [Firmicutes bacterium]|jgi:riboflavin transporter FmnP|nr:ECF transporter S component [Bacillota bacterium]
MNSTKKLVLAGLFLALGLALPFLTGQIPNIGKMLLPMHLPVLIAGFVLGAPWGLAIGLIVPVLRSLLFSLPPMFPAAVAMSFELAAYGLFAGLFYKLLPKKNIYIYISLALAMVLGRAVWGAVSWVLYGLKNTAFIWQAFAAGAYFNAIPGIILQLVLIPVIIIGLKQARLLENDC